MFSDSLTVERPSDTSVEMGTPSVRVRPSARWGAVVVPPRKRSAWRTSLPHG